MHKILNETIYLYISYPIGICFFFYVMHLHLLIFRYFDRKQEDRKHKKKKNSVQYSVIAHIFIIETHTVKNIYLVLLKIIS